MAINAYYGKPRQGKSYSVVSNVIAPALAKGRTVYTNIPLTDKCLSLGGEVVSFDNDVPVDYFTMLPKGIVLVIDEAWRYFPSGQRTDKIGEGIKEYLAMHGHMVNDNGDTTQINVITQDASDLNAFIKTKVDTAYVISKKSGAGVTQFRTDVYSGNSATKAKGEADNSFFSSFKKQNFELYKTSTLSDTDHAGNESSLDGRGGIFGNVMIKYGLPLSLVLMVGGAYKAYSYFVTFGESPKIEPVALTQVEPVRLPKVNQPLPVEVVQVEQLPILSRSLRVSGYSVYTATNIVVHIEHFNGHVFNLPAVECEPKYGSYSCLLDGEIVNAFSGKVLTPSESIISTIPFSES